MVDYKDIGALDQRELTLTRTIEGLMRESEKDGNPQEREILSKPIEILRKRLEEVRAQTSIADN